MHGNMNMTHYMELLATNQPWNLIIFMAIPVILAEFIAVTELIFLLNRDFNSGVKRANRIASIVAGIYFLFIFIYLFFTAFIPLSTQGGWRGIADVIAVGFYLLGVVPLFGMTLLELGIIARGRTDQDRIKFHAGFVGLFLVVAHVAMIFGMLDPRLLA
jgi:hypothetical protein